MFNLKGIKKSFDDKPKIHPRKGFRPRPGKIKNPNLTGRPRLEDQVFLTDEMERFANEIRSGFTPEETAERMGIPVDKAIRFSLNKTVQNRIKILLGDKLNYWANLRDDLYETCLKTARKLIQQGKIPWQNLQWFVDRLEHQFLIAEPPKQKMIMAKEETYLPSMEEETDDEKPQKQKRKLLSKRTIEMKEENQKSDIPEVSSENAENIETSLEEDGLKELSNEDIKQVKQRLRGNKGGNKK